MKKNKLTIVTIILIVLIISGSLYCKYSLNKDLIFNDKSYAYTSDKNGLSKYIDEVSLRIKELDKTFNKDDYIITYNESPSDTNLETITLTYVIDNIIETNKTYKVIIENETIKDIYLSNTESINEQDLMSLVDKFNNETKESILIKDHQELFKQNKILNKDKSINESRFIPSITRYEEKYLYNYNTKELSYNLNIYNDELEEIKIEIN